MSEVDYEAEARLEGWVPEEEFQGENKPKEFVDAKTFVERGQEINGVLKNKVSRLDDQIQSLQVANAEFKKHHERTLENERRENERLINELESVREKAITEGDGTAFTKADKEIQDIRANPTEDGKTFHDNLAQTWVTSNKWYKDNERLAAYADGIAPRVEAGGYTGEAYFNELTRRVKEAFPEEFTPQRQTSVESGKVSETIVVSTGREFDDLPADAKAAYSRFSKQFEVSKEDYLANYEWD